MMKISLLTSASSAALFFMAGTMAFAGSPITPITVLPPVVAPTASGNWYASVFAGGGVVQDVVTDYYGSEYTVRFDAGYVLGATVGRRINDNWRVEGELSYASYEANSYADTAGGSFDNAEGPLNAVYLLANLWYDIPNSSRFTPYVGGGLGMAKVDGDTFFDDDVYGYGPGETKFAYQVGAGVSYGINDRMSLDVGYRYKAVDGVNFDDSDGGGVYENGDVHTHTLQAGLRFDF